MIWQHLQSKHFAMPVYGWGFTGQIYCQSLGVQRAKEVVIHLIPRLKIQNVWD